MFYGHYRASKQGCPKEFVTTGKDILSFPPQMSYYCSLCKAEHGFRYVEAHLVSTPRQEKAFEGFCNQKSIEREVALG